MAYNICFLNIRSLHKHNDLVRTDHILSACHLNIYCETRVAATDNANIYNIDRFQTVMYPHTAVSGQRSHYGLAIFSQLPVLDTCQPVTFASSFGSVECSLVQVPLTANITSCRFHVHSHRTTQPLRWTKSCTYTTKVCTY